jgi:hypothetical protein
VWLLQSSADGVRRLSGSRRASRHLRAPQMPPPPPAPQAPQPTSPAPLAQDCESLLEQNGPDDRYHILFIGIRMQCDLFTRGTIPDQGGDPHLLQLPPPPLRSYTTTPPQRPLELGVERPLQHRGLPWTRAPCARSVEETEKHRGPRASAGNRSGQTRMRF